MSLPKKQKLTVDLNPPKIGTEYLKYGMDRIEELMNQTNEKTTFLPRTILLEDIDLSLFEYISSDKVHLVLDGKEVPSFYMDNDRWGEFSKTWKFMDDDKNVPTPYITVRRIDKQPGTRIGTNFRIPQFKKFRYYDVPILDEGQIVYLQFRTPEPINVDLTYEITLFTKYRVDVNLFDTIILKNFSSMQEYLNIKGYPIPITFEGFAESNPIENIDGDKFFVAKYAVKVHGMIQDEKEFEIIKTARSVKIDSIVK